MGDFTPLRSVLYMPSSNERALEKAKTIACDGLILDLEDAVAPDAKPAAREAACAAAASGEYGRRTVTIRANGIGTEWHDADLVATRCGDPAIASGTDPADPTITVNGTDVSTEIRSTEVTAAVSPVSTVPAVRRRLLTLQRELIGDGGIVVEGRDIGSVVWPQAEVKVYLSADPAARARRRIAEHAHLGDVATAEAGLRERDQIDSGRATAPLTMADGAVLIDTTDHTLDEVVDQVVALAEDLR